MSRSAAEGESFGRIPATCPNVDEAMEQAKDELLDAIQSALGDLDDKVKGQTESLRDQLTDTCRELIEAQDEVGRLRDELEDAQNYIEELTAQLREMEAV